MKKSRSIARVFSLFLASVLLIASVAVKGVSARPLPLPAAPTEKSDHTSGTPKATVQALSPMATVTVADFSFTQDFYLLPPAVYSFETVTPQPTSIGITQFRLPYQEVLFEHVISPNAP